MGVVFMWSASHRRKMSAWSVLVVVSLGLLACGGGGGSGASGDLEVIGGAVTPPPSDAVAPSAAFQSAPSVLSRAQPLIVAFSEPMDAGTLSLNGSLGAAAVATWNASADTLTLSPGPGGWPRGSGQVLGLAARDRAGNALAPLSGRFLVPLEFIDSQPAVAVIGQPDFISSAANRPGSGGPAGSNLNNPVGNPWLSPEGRLVVPDTGNHRLLIFDPVPQANGATASAVIGQPDFFSNAQVVDAAHRISPRGIAAGAGRFVVSEFEADRVAIYDRSPVEAPAVLPTVVLGASDFTASSISVGCNVFPWRLMRPTGVAVTPDGKLLVSDSGHNRVLIWKQMPTVSNQSPDLVLGQSDFTSCGANARVSPLGAVVPSNRSLSAPVGLWTDGTRLVVIDAGNRRALVWNTFPSANFQPADLVLGQPDFTSDQAISPSDALVSTENAGASFYGEVTSNGLQLAIADTYGSRVLLWDSFPTRNFQPADRVLGRAPSTPTSRPVTQESTYFPTGLLMVRDYLFVVNVNRVSIFKSN